MLGAAKPNNKAFYLRQKCPTAAPKKSGRTTSQQKAWWTTGLLPSRSILCSLDSHAKKKRERESKGMKHMSPTYTDLSSLSDLFVFILCKTDQFQPLAVRFCVTCSWFHSPISTHPVTKGGGTYAFPRQGEWLGMQQADSTQTHSERAHCHMNSRLQTAAKLLRDRVSVRDGQS